MTHESSGGAYGATLNIIVRMWIKKNVKKAKISHIVTITPLEIVTTSIEIIK